MTKEINIEPVFFTVFSAWFDADLIDLDDDKEVKIAAGICASDLNKQVTNLNKLISELQEVVDSWDPALIMLFINAARTDWLADEELENSLKHILEEIIKGLKHFQQSRS